MGLQFTSTPVSEGGIDKRYANYGEKGYNSPATITRRNVRSTALLQMGVCVFCVAGAQNAALTAI